MDKGQGQDLPNGSTAIATALPNQPVPAAENPFKRKTEILTNIPEVEETRGRPSKLPGVNLSKVTKMAATGMTLDQIATVLEVDDSTISRWIDENEEFRRAIKKGRDKADTGVQRSLWERAIGYRTKYKKNFVVSDGKDSGSHVEAHDEELVFPPDPVSCFFWLKNRRPMEWRDKVETQADVNLTLTGLIRDVVNARGKEKDSKRLNQRS